MESGGHSTRKLEAKVLERIVGKAQKRKADFETVERRAMREHVAKVARRDVVYSVKNKQAHIALGLPLSIATAQVGGGAVVAALLWGLRIRTPPKLSSAAFRTLLPIGLFHGIGHLTGVLATALGSVSFVQVVKSAGPFWACILSGIFLGQRNSRRVWLSLVPVVGGVGLASANELKFVWSCFFTSVASDIALATRNVLSKKTMGSHTQVR